MSLSRPHILQVHFHLQRLKQQLEQYRSQFWMKEKKRGALTEVQQFFGLIQPKQLKPWVHTSLVARINNFEVEFRFIATFLGYVTMWSDASKVVQNLEFLDLRIEVTMKEIRDDLRTAYDKEYIRQCPSKLIDLVSVLLDKLNVPKSEIKEAYDRDDYFSSRSFKSISPLHIYDQWNEFVISILDNMQALIKKLVIGYDLKEQFIAFKDHFSRFLCFVEDVFPYCPEEDLRIADFINFIGDVAIHTAHLSCLCWFKEEIDSNMAKEIVVMLSDLQQKIQPTTLEFLDVNLQFLQAMKNKLNYMGYKGLIGSEYLKDRFVKYLLDGINLDVLHEEMKFLVSTVAHNKRQLSGEDVQSVLPDIKAIIIQVGVLKCMLDREMGTDTVLLKLVAKIWLIRAEVFLMEQLNGSPDLIQASYQYRALDTRLSFLRTYFRDLPEAVGDKEDDKLTFPFLEEINRSVTSLCYSRHDKEVTNSRATDAFFMLLLKILLFKAESSVASLLRSDASLLVLLKDRIRDLHEELRFFTTLVTSQQDENTEEDGLIFGRIFSVSKGMISLYNPVLDNKITEEMALNMNLLLTDLFDEINLVKADLKENYQKFPRHNIPKTNALGFIDFLLRRVIEMLKYNPKSIEPVKHQFETILGDLKYFRSFLTDIVKQDSDSRGLKDIGTHIVNMAYRVEYVIDLIVAGGSWCGFSWFNYLLEDIRLLKFQSSEIYEKKATHFIVQKVAQACKHEVSLTSTQRIDEFVVELHDQEEAILDRLTRGSLQRDMIAIVGMPGIGKTTTAKKVFNDPKVAYHFHVRAWCHVSQVYIKRDMLLDILSNISEATADILQMADADLELMLYQKLKQKRYLVVMDDMWNTGAWDDLERSLPNDRNGSRILMTSRLRDVALKAKPDSEPHPLRLLSGNESWNLLQRKIFHEQSCPEELLEIGMKISRSCRGLPLAIVAIAGVLERANRTQYWWEQIAESMSSYIFDDPEMQCKAILELSYRHLPDHLKACFLYFGAFYEEKDILVQRLIWLWIGEGFVQKREDKSLEDIAEEYLNDLISRSLVMVAKRKSSGGVKACRVHDILRELCQSKCKEENFFRIISKYDEPHASFDDSDYEVDFDYNDRLDSVRYDDHRLCIFTKRKYLVMSKPSSAHARSLLLFATSDMYPRCPYDLSFISHNFKLLRVLDLECINMGTSFLSRIELLVHLRYLAVRGDIDSVPSSISNLWNLEILIVKGLKGKVLLPDTIWIMARLQHVHVNNHAIFRLQDVKQAILYQLDNLVSLSSPSFSNAEDAEIIIRRFPNLRKFRCIFLETKNSSENFICFPRLDSLSQLESLKISYFGTAPTHNEFHLPLNLRKLTLSKFRLPWDLISAIGKLPNLEVLKLLCRAFEGEVWEMREREFVRLKFLKLDTLNIVRWSATNDHLPNLQHLALRKCKQLEEVPSAFVEISTLQVIEVNDCGHCADELVTRIEEEGIEGLKVLINNSN